MVFLRWTLIDYFCINKKCPHFKKYKFLYTRTDRKSEVVKCPHCSEIMVRSEDLNNTEKWNNPDY